MVFQNSRRQPPPVIRIAAVLILMHAAGHATKIKLTVKTKLMMIVVVVVTIRAVVTVVIKITMSSMMT
jgi:hypothetical protein